MSCSKWAETGEASHRKNKRAKLKYADDQDEADYTSDCARMSPAASFGRHSSPRRTTTSTFWTIVIAFMTSQLISLCDPLTTTSASSSPASTGLQSNNNRHGSVLSMALAGSPPVQHTFKQRSHQPQNQQYNHHQHHPAPVSSTANLIQNSWPASYAGAGRQEQNFNALTGTLISQSASLLPPSESAALQQHQQHQPMFHQLAPLSMYHHPQTSSNEQTPHTSGTLQQHIQQTPSTHTNTQPQSNSSPASYYEDSAGDSDLQDGSEGSSSGASANFGDQLISSGTRELGQEAPPGLGTQSEPQSQFQSARERCRELISLTLLSFKDLTPNERASEEIDCASLREQIAAATGRASAQLNSSPPSQSSRRQPQQAQVIKQTASPLLEPQDQFSDSSSASTGVEIDASSSTSSQLTPEEFPLQLSPNANLNSQPRQLVPVNPPPRPNGRSQASLQSQLAQSPRKPQLSLALQPQLAASGNSQSSGAQQEVTGSASSDPQQQFLGSKWDPKNTYINQVQALLLQQQQQQQSQRAQEHQNMLHFYKQLAAVQRQHSQPQISQPATTTYTPVSTTTTTTTSLPPTTLATTFESLLETTTLPPTTTSTTTTTTTTTTRPNQPKIRVGAPPGRRPKKARPRSTTTTTTTTTTQKPSTMADYADSSDVSTDYYEDYEDQSQQQTTTTTTTRKPRQKGRRRPTTPKPTTTTTTLSPGYQPRPDGRIIDYMADPNFPRELKGADLTNYPFYISVPEKIDFDCKGRHDGYYSNIDLHCQIYHHCAIGNRYDFLCPNYTLFDQTTFTCRFINTVDCEGSTKHYDKNNALYVEKDKEQPASSTTSTTTSTTTTQAPKLISRRTGAIELAVEDKAVVANVSFSPPVPLDRISALALIVQQQRQMRAGLTSGAPSSQSKQDTAVK